MSIGRVHIYKGEASAGMRRGTWTEDEDQVIIDSVQEGFTKWSDIGKRFPNERTGKQCRERWFNHLDPTLKKGPWSEEEDHALMKAQARMGNAWTKIATEIPGRSENEVKNRWYSAAIRNRRVVECKMDMHQRKKRRLDDDAVSATSQPVALLSPDDQISYHIAEANLPTMLQAYRGTMGVTSAESSSSNGSPAPFLPVHLDGQPIHGSGLTTPLSFLGAFSSSGGSPTWFEGTSHAVGAGAFSSDSTGSRTGASSAGGTGSGSRSNSISDALHLLLQGITMPGDIVVPTVAQRWPAEVQESK